MLPQRIKKIFFAVWLVGNLLLGLPAVYPACAADETITFRSTAKFAAGVLASVAVHEGAHALVAAATNTDLTWKFGNYNQPLAFTENAASDIKGLALYSAGLLAQLISS